jgi:hypothetical protein
MVWKPAKTLGLIAGLITILTIMGVDAFLVRGMTRTGLGLNFYFMILLLVLSLPLFVLFLYWYYSLVTLSYYLDRNALIISYGYSRHVVPLGAIRRIIPGTQAVISQVFRGVGWPGYLMGSMRLEDLGSLLVYSTEPLDRQLVVITDRQCYGISPKDAAHFLEDYAARRALGPIREVEQAVEHASFVASPVWSDRWFWGIIILALVANAVLLGLIVDRYGRLPERIPLHFDARGQLDRIVAKSGFLVVPGIGALALLFNSVFGTLLYRRERLAAYLLVIMTLGVQAVLWIAALGILNR